MDDNIYEKKLGNTFEKRCKHYDGMDATDRRKACKAGVLMESVVVHKSYRYRYTGSPRGHIFESPHSTPCFVDDDPCGVCACEHQEFPSTEEIAVHKKEVGKLLERTFLARASIVVETGGKRGVTGEMQCPVCTKGTLRYSVASVNGHIHAACSTPDCVRWME